MHYMLIPHPKHNKQVYIEVVNACGRVEQETLLILYPSTIVSKQSPKSSVSRNKLFLCLKISFHAGCYQPPQPSPTRSPLAVPSSPLLLLTLLLLQLYLFLQLQSAPKYVILCFLLAVDCS